MQEEFLCSDHIFLGGRIIANEQLQREFPKWYNKWKMANGKKKLSDYCLLPDYSYGISASLNAVYSVNFEKATAEFTCSFETERNEGGMYFPPIRMGNILTFTPLKEHRWAFYNLDTCKWTYKEIPSELIPREEMIIRFRVCVGKRILHVIENCNVVACMDASTGEISYYDCLNEIRQKDGTLPTFSAMVVYDESVLLFANTGNNVYEIDTKTMRVVKTHKIPMECNAIQQAVVIRGTDWLCLLEQENHISRVIKWNIMTGEAREVLDLSNCSKENHNVGPIGGFCNDFDGLYIILRQEKYFMKLDWRKNEATRIELHTELELLERKNAYYNRCEYGNSFIVLAYNAYRNKFTVFLPYDFSIAEIDFEKGVFLNKRKWKVSGIEKLIRDSLKTQVDGVHMENQFFGLKEFADDLKAGKL